MPQSENVVKLKHKHDCKHEIRGAEKFCLTIYRQFAIMLLPSASCIFVQEFSYPKYYSLTYRLRFDRAGNRTRNSIGK